MSLTSNRLLAAASGAGVDKLYVDDVFSAYTVTDGTGTITVSNGIDLAGKGGLVWIKRRSNAADNLLLDSHRGVNYILRTNTTAAQENMTGQGIAFNSDGYSYGQGYGYLQANGNSSINWTFRKAPKFFDVVTYTGNGGSLEISHSLGITPGMLIIKRTDNTGNWVVAHIGSGGWVVAVNGVTNFGLNTANAGAAATQGAPANSTTFKADPGYYNAGGGTGSNTNALGGTYVAYLFAHDPSADGIVQCGSYVGNGSATGPVVTLGWEPQYVMVKSSSNSGTGWLIFDSARGLGVSSKNTLSAENTASESGTYDGRLSVNAQGFSLITAGFEPNANGTTYIYLAIRRPNKPPTLGTQVYNAIARTGTGAAATVTGVGFAPDVLITKSRNNSFEPVWFDRLRGAPISIKSTSTGLEQSFNDNLASFDMSGITVRAETLANLACINAASYTYINHFFKRAPGVFDVVCYTGNDVRPRNIAHNLSSPPEMLIMKSRSTGSWFVYHSAMGTDSHIFLNGNTVKQTAALTGDDIWNSTTPTATQFSIGTGGNRDNYNWTNIPYVVYLFATKAGVSKCGSYTGNGTSQTIDCGFTTGARFVLIKRTDATGDWYVWDTVRGLVAGNDPHLSLNSSAAEVTTNDSLDPANAGFIVNQLAATNINVTSASYIYLSFA